MHSQRPPASVALTCTQLPASRCRVLLTQAPSVQTHWTVSCQPGGRARKMSMHPCLQHGLMSSFYLPQMLKQHIIAANKACLDGRAVLP